jgi:replicative DNA helicase
MSEQKPVSETLKKFQDDLEKDKILDEKKKELQQNKLLVESHRYTNELARIEKGEEGIKRTSNVNVGLLTEENILDMQNQNKAYLDGAKNGMMFLNKELSKIVPFWPGCLALIGARTGGGKSSLAANLIVSTLRQINPITGKNRKVLLISAEELPITCYNRLTCHVKNFNFDAQDEFTEEQKQTLVDYTANWARMGVTVLGEDGFGLTSSIEGIDSIFKNIIKTKTHYDLILIDYIQKVNKSLKNPNMKSHEVLRDTMYLLDGYKNNLNSAIGVMTQLSSQKSGDDSVELDFQDRLRGCRDLITPATVAIELVPFYSESKSRFIIRKNRYKGNTVGGHVDLGYDRGKYVSYTDEFKKEATSKKESRDWNETVGKHVFEKKNEEKI